ncbi:MAG: carbamoyltransferase [Crocinitomicaceae bacterium]|jgi:carbamoyltransferase
MIEKYYIGVGTTYHDPSISIINGKGEVLFAEATERYLQNKRAFSCTADPMVWINDIMSKYCDLDGEFHIATTWSKSHVRSLKNLKALGFLKKQPTGISRIIFRMMRKSILSDEILTWFFKQQLASNTHSGTNIELNLRMNHNNDKVKWHRFNHHLTHAAAACYSSGFKDATCLVMDGEGEVGSASYYHYKNGKVELISHNKGFGSLGYFYAVVTELCGFSTFKGEEWKVMGMAPYGQKDNVFYEQLSAIFVVENLKIKFKSKHKDINAILKAIEERISESKNDFQLKANLAHTGQLIFSEQMTKLIGNLYAKGLSENLVYTGGCALNSAFNGYIQNDKGFKNVYVPSAPGDDGNSLGAAYLAYYKDNENAPVVYDEIQSPYLGSEIDDEQVLSFIKYSGVTNYKHLPNEIAKETAKKLAEGKLVGWVQGRGEFGPRALGNRSILADPRSKDMKDKINSRVKFREEFRPFAPSILEEFGPEYFENYQDTPYMDRTLIFRPEVVDKVPAVVHSNRSGRLQSVKKDLNPKYHELISEFHTLTDIPILLNTSFNVMGKPIVHSFNDALMVFFNSGLDVLVVNDYIFEKGEG